MTKAWVCTICGSTALSKCPSQRNVFPGMEHAIWSSILYTEVIRGKEGRREVIFTVTDFLDKHEKASDTQMIMDILTRMAESKDAIANAICDHHWVLNSHTETECSMGCTHSNLDTKFETDTFEEKPWEASRMIKDFYTPIKVLLEQCRIMLNVTKNKFDDYAEEQNYQLKNLISKAIDKYAAGENILPKYRVTLSYGYNDSRKGYKETFNDDAACQAFVRGLILQRTEGTITTEKYDTELNRYVDFSWVDTSICGFCGGHLNIREPNVDGEAHVKCQALHEKRAKVKPRWFDLPMPMELDKRRDEYGHDYVDRNLLRYVTDLRCIYQHKIEVEILEVESNRRWMCFKNSDGKRDSRQTIRVKAVGTWYDGQNLKQVFIEN